MTPSIVKIGETSYYFSSPFYIAMMMHFESRSNNNLVGKYFSCDYVYFWSLYIDEPLFS